MKDALHSCRANTNSVKQEVLYRCTVLCGDRWGCPSLAGKVSPTETEQTRWSQTSVPGTSISFETHRCPHHYCMGEWQVMLLTQICFPIAREYVRCRWSKLLGERKLTNSLWKQLSTRTWSGRAHWNSGKFVVPANVKQIIFLQSFFYFWVRSLRLGEHQGSRGNKTYCFAWDQSLIIYSLLDLIALKSVQAFIPVKFM